MATVLGISAWYHDSAAALIHDGVLVGAAQEERFSRKKHDAAFPSRAVAAVLKRAGVQTVDQVVFYERPLPKLDRLLETWLATAPRGFRAFRHAAPRWTGDRLFPARAIRRELRQFGIHAPVTCVGHHRSHAASAFIPSPFERAAVVTLDGVGEWETTTIARGEGTQITPLATQHFPHSLGLLYSVFTAYCGFRVNNGEYKVMGLAALGEPRFADAIREHLLDLRDDGSFRLDVRTLGLLTGERPSQAFCELFGGPPRRPEGPLDARFADVAASIQAVTEEVVAAVVRQAVVRTGSRDVCLAGGVALNAVANGKLVERGLVDRLWVQPAAGDAGGALGAALVVDPLRVSMGACDLGPRLSDRIAVEAVVDALAAGKVVGLAQGGMEFGPRALGFRSILADPRRPDMQDRVNALVKKREAFRPFAPAVLAERASAWFDLAGASPHMTRVGRVLSELPAVTHVDGTARVQTVDAVTSPAFHEVLTAWFERTGCPVLLNTSFNVRGEPIVCTAEDALRCFRSTGIDALALDGELIR